jgi:O-antigen ligase
MASRGLYKDSVGYAELTQADKFNVRKGYTNYLQPQWNFLRRRSYELVNEYDEFVNGRAVNGHSFTMRLYFWKAAKHAIALHPFFGVGSGDVKQALDNSYSLTNSPLSQEWRIRPHNQFLTVTVALGITGLLLFLFSVFAPAIRSAKSVHVLYWPFLMLAAISFMFEDTLETQAGLTFYAFFNTVLLCEWWSGRRTVSDYRVVPASAAGKGADQAQIRTS